MHRGSSTAHGTALIGSHAPGSQVALAAGQAQRKGAQPLHVFCWQVLHQLSSLCL